MHPLECVCVYTSVWMPEIIVRCVSPVVFYFLVQGLSLNLQLTGSQGSFPLSPALELRLCTLHPAFLWAAISELGASCLYSQPLDQHCPSLQPLYGF